MTICFAIYFGIEGCFQELSELFQRGLDTVTIHQLTNEV